MSKAGYLISFEGIGGSGKTSIVHRMKKYLESIRKKSIIKNDLVQYAGTGLGGAIRKLLIEYSDSDRFFRTGYPTVETLLILAKRTYESDQSLLPELQKGVIVLADRDIDTVCTYQLVSLLKAKPSLDIKAFVKLVRDVNRFSSVDPSLTYFLDVTVANAIDRIKKRDRKGVDSNEIAFFKEAKSLYKKVLSIRIPKRDLVVIDTNKVSLDQVFNYIKDNYKEWQKRR